MTSHQLADFRKSPYLFKKKRSGLIQQHESAAYGVGTAAHCLILEGEEAFRARYTVGGPINPKTDRPYGRDTQAYKQWAAEQKNEVLCDDDYALIVQLCAAVRSHKKACELLAEGTPEAVLRADYCGTPCQVRFDWLSPLSGIVDLKTCYDIDNFPDDAAKYQYVHQLAFYREILALQMAGELVPCTFIAVEKQEPFRCGVFGCPEAKLTAAAAENEAAMVRFLQCRDTNDWPTGYEEVRSL